jgi:hypothetical protein
MQKLLRIVSVIHWNFTGTDLKNGLGEPTALHQNSYLRTKCGKTMFPHERIF